MIHAIYALPNVSHWLRRLCILQKFIKNLHVLQNFLIGIFAFDDFEYLVTSWYSFCSVVKI